MHWFLYALRTSVKKQLHGVGFAASVLALSALSESCCASDAVAGDAPKFSTYVPLSPYSVLSENLYARELQNDVVDGMRVRNLYLLVGPHKITAPAAFNGASNEVVLTGSGALSYQSDQGIVQRQILPGTTWSLPANQPFTIDNPNDEQIDIRTTVITPSP